MLHTASTPVVQEWWYFEDKGWRLLKVTEKIDLAAPYLLAACKELLLFLPTPKPEEGGLPSWILDIEQRAKAAIYMADPDWRGTNYA